MKSIATALSIATVLASLAVSVPLKIFKREIFNDAAVIACAASYFTTGILAPGCASDIIVPGVIKTVEFDNLYFDFTAPDQWAPLLSSSSFVGTIIDLKLSLPIPVASISIHVDVFYNNDNVGKIETPANNAEAKGVAVTTSFQTISMPIPEGAHKDFSSLLVELVTTKSSNVRLAGTLDVAFNFPFPIGKKALTLGLDVITTFSGFNSLHDTTFKSVISNNKDDVAKKQTLTLEVNVKSSSIVSVKVGDIMFNAAGLAGPIGTVTLKNAVLVQGDNLLTAIVVIDMSLSGATAFITGLENADATMTLTGTGSSPANDAILPAIQALKVDLVIPQKSFTKTV